MTLKEFLEIFFTKICSIIWFCSTLLQTDQTKSITESIQSLSTFHP